MNKFLNLFVVVFGIATFLISCSDNEVAPTPTPTDVAGGNGPSTKDELSIPTSQAYLGDSIHQTKTFSLTQNPVNKVTVTTTLNGYISVLGGYKENAAVYIYAKPDDDGSTLSQDQVTSLLAKYYNVAIDASGSDLNVDIAAKMVTHEVDYRKLRISVKIFTPTSTSTRLSIADGSIFVNNLTGEQHVATSVSGAIKYINSSGKSFIVQSTSGYLGFVNTTASESITANLSRGSIQFAVPQNTKATLDLKSSTNVTASVLTALNFKGTNTRLYVGGDLNGGGYKINAQSTLGSVVFKWYQEGID